MWGALALLVAAAALLSSGSAGAAGPAGPPGGTPPAPKPQGGFICNHPCSGSAFLAFQQVWNKTASLPGSGYQVIAEDGCVGPATCAAAGVALKLGFSNATTQKILSSCGC